MSLQDIHDLYSVPHIKSLEIKVSDGSTLGNPDLVVEKAELTDSLSSASELMFGSCEAACFKLQVATADKEYKNLWFDVWATVQENSGDLMIDDSHYLLLSDGSKMRMNPYLHSGQIGRFRVVLDEPVADRSWRNLTCYDAMYDILRAEVGDWYSGLTFPMTVKALRDSFFSFLGIEQEETTLIHDNLVVQGNFVATSKLSGRTIIKAICELGGVFGHINPEGKFVYLSIPSEDSVTYSYYRDGTGMYERDVVEPITGIIARDAEDDAGTIVGTMDNPYIITGNPLVFGIEGTPELEDVLNTLLTKISAVTYRPFSVTSYGNPFLPVGTSVVVNTKNMTINSLIMTKRLAGIQALKDTISAKGQKERLNDTIDLSSELYQTDGRYHLLRNDVNGLESEVYDEHGNSVISQMANEVVLKVDSSGKIVNVELTAEASGSAFKVVADNIDFISDGKIQLTSKSLEINSTNFTVTSAGAITAKSGTIGGWTITNNALYNGMTSLSDTTHDGVWIGQDGIALGKGKFKVTNAGALTAKSGTIGGWGITDTRLQVQPAGTGLFAVLEYTQLSVVYASGTTIYTGDYYGHEICCTNWSSGSPAQTHVVNLRNVRDTSTTLGQALNGASDKRLKKNIKKVDSKLLDAINECEIKQYKLYNKNGEISFGIIAQDFVKACEDRGLNALDYEMIFEDIIDREDDTKYYIMNFNQLNMLEIASLKAEIAKLKKQITEG